VILSRSNHPKITFKSTRIERKRDGEYVVHGDITIRGVTKPIALDVELVAPQVAAKTPAAPVSASA
jgi:polyisoprenoid-binding protein YceI